MGTIIGVGGKIGSGKTYWKNIIASYYNCKSVSFSDWLKDLARNRKVDKIDRGVLQDLGVEMLQRGYEFVLNGILKYASWTGEDILIIDGIRDICFFEYLKKQIYPHQAILLFITVDEKTRMKRINERHEFLINEAHSAEGNASLVQEGADIIITNASSDYEVLSKIDSKIYSL